MRKEGKGEKGPSTYSLYRKANRKNEKGEPISLFALLLLTLGEGEKKKIKRFFSSPSRGGESGTLEGRE